LLARFELVASALTVLCVSFAWRADYGNAENHIGADGAGTMEAIYFGNSTQWWVPANKVGDVTDSVAVA
jgi:hypothetical protein